MERSVTLSPTSYSTRIEIHNRGVKRTGVKMTTHLYSIPRLRMNIAIPHLPL